MINTNLEDSLRIWLEQKPELKPDPVDAEELRKDIAANTGVPANKGEKLVDIDFFADKKEEESQDTQPIDSKSLTPEDKIKLLKQEEAKKIELAVRLVMANLSHTLGVLGNKCLSKYEEDPEANQKFAAAAQTVNLMALGIKETGKGSLQFARDYDGEKRLREIGKSDGVHPADEVFIYKAGPCRVGGIEMTKIDFFIRPRRYVSEIQTRNGQPLRETKQARTLIEVVSPLLPTGMAQIRIDRPSYEKPENLSYDVIVTSDNRNVIDDLDLADVGQIAGHHFNSEIPLTKFALLPWQIHKGIADRLDSLTQPKTAEPERQRDTLEDYL